MKNTTSCRSCRTTARAGCGWRSATAPAATRAATAGQLRAAGTSSPPPCSATAGLTPVELPQSGGRNDMRRQLAARPGRQRLLRLRQRQPRLDAAEHAGRATSASPSAVWAACRSRPTQVPLTRATRRLQPRRRRSIRTRPSRSPASAATRSSRRQDLPHLPRRPAPPHRHLRRRRRRRLADGPAPLRPRRGGPRFLLVADHNMGDDNEYSWWRTQKANDLYTVPGAFISMYGYERSVPYPNGHRNVLWTERGHRTLPLPQAACPSRWPRTPQAVRLPAADRRHLHAAHLRHRPGHRLGRARRRAGAVRRDLPGLPRLLRGARRPEAR